MGTILSLIIGTINDVVDRIMPPWVVVKTRFFGWIWGWGSDWTWAVPSACVGANRSMTVPFEKKVVLDKNAASDNVRKTRCPVVSGVIAEYKRKR